MAYNGTGKEKVLAGERTVDFPETLDEAKAMFGEADSLEYIKSSYVIEVQRQIRSGTTVSAKSQLASLLAKAQNDPKLAEMLKACDIVLPWEAHNGEATAAPTPPAAPEAPAPETPPVAEKPKVIRRRASK